MQENPQLLLPSTPTSQVPQSPAARLEHSVKTGHNRKEQQQCQGHMLRTSPRANLPPPTCPTCCAPTHSAHTYVYSSVQVCHLHSAGCVACTLGAARLLPSDQVAGHTHTVQAVSHLHIMHAGQEDCVMQKSILERVEHVMGLQGTPMPFRQSAA
jgi:hypothetical protein